MEKEKRKIQENTKEIQENVKTEKNNEDKDKKETEKVVEQKLVKKNTAVVNANQLKISTKHSMAICNMIRGKTTEQALNLLEEVLRFKKVVKMNNREVGHKPGKGIMAGRYPQNACKEFIRLIKQLNANAVVNEVPIEEMTIFCKADVGSRSYRRMGQRFKSTNLQLKLEKKIKKNKKSKNKLRKK